MIKSEIVTDSYLDSLISKIHKIIPLYENQNKGLYSYVDSLLFKLKQYQSCIEYEAGSEYMDLVLALKGICTLCEENEFSGESHAIIRRECFNSISLVKGMIRNKRGK